VAKDLSKKSSKSYVYPKKAQEIRADVNEMRYLQIFTTVGKREDAERIAETLVQIRLAGCVQVVGPISSTYWWKSKIEKAEEWLALPSQNRRNAIP
jgi:hypothetical protein